MSETGVRSRGTVFPEGPDSGGAPDQPAIRNESVNRKIRTLTFTTLYPNAAMPVHGVFVEQRLRHLVESGEVETQVFAPVPWFPIDRYYFGRYARFARVPAREERHGIAVLHPRYPAIPRIGMVVAPFLLAAACRALVHRIMKGGYEFDLIDSHYFYPDGVAAALLGRELRKPVVITARGSDINLIANYRLPRKLILWAAQSAEVTIAVSQSLKDRMVHAGVPRDRIAVLRNGVDTKLFHPVDREECRRRFGLNSITLLSVGQLVSHKGPDIVISALQKLPGVRLLLIGDGADKGRLQRLAELRGVANQVQFLGEIPQERLKDYYTACDAVVLCSSREGWPNVLLEAMACGTPVIASNVGGVPEIVASAEAGVLMRERTCEGFARAYAALFDNYPDREATHRYASRFSWDDTTAGQISLFRRALGR